MTGKQLRSGYTTGTCAAAAAKAAAYRLLSGYRMDTAEITTPAGKTLCLPVRLLAETAAAVTCAVTKDAGDDPDVTDGMDIVATVSYGEGEGPHIHIDGGTGIGRVTKPGLDQPVGAAAINRVPRQMIRAAVGEVCARFWPAAVLSVIISAPDGQEAARHTMNERLGIVGGISILGTTGIVEPMSEDALLAAIRLEIRQKKRLGADILPLAIGNYGQRFLLETYQFDLDVFVKCSNYIGDAIRMAGEEGFDRTLLAGHVGKLVKVSGGRLNTHSRYGDARMELLASAWLDAGGDTQTVRRVLDSVSTEEAIHQMAKSDRRTGRKRLSKTMDRVMDKLMETLNRHAAHQEIACLMYANRYGILAMGGRAKEWLWCIS